MSSPQELKTNWLKRRWFDFRNGHSTYLIFVVQFVQFIVITYQLYIADSPLNTVFSDMTHWVAFFVLTYIPAAIVAGHIHRKRQMGTDQAQQIDVNPLSYKTVITDGKESLYTLRVNRLAYLLQLKNMRINNQIAEALNNATGSKIETWTEQDMEQVHEFAKISKALESGEDVRTVRFREYEIK